MGVDIVEKRSRSSIGAWLEKARKAGSVDVGILGAESTALEPNGATVLEVACKNEFGLGVPERPFVRGYVDAHRKDIEAFIEKSARKAAKEGHPPEWALERIGLFVQTGVQKFIAAHGEGTYPENAPYTIKKKGSSTPLIDTGQLRSSINFRQSAIPAKAGAV